MKDTRIAAFRRGWHTPDMFEDVNREIEDIFRRQLFFIAATEKSGTTWMQVMLNAHPEISCRGEGQFITKLAPEIGRGLNGYSEFIRGLNSTVFGEIEGFPTLDREDHLHLLRSAAGLLFLKYPVTSGTKAVGEKTPGNVRCLAALRATFPGAKFVLMIRDVRDVAVSGYVHIERQHGTNNGESIANYAKRLAKIWAKDVARAQTMNSDHPDDCVMVRYEDLHASPHDELDRVFRLLGVATGPEQIGCCVDAGSFEKLSGGRKRGEEKQSSQFRKGIIGDWRTGLNLEAKQAIQQEAGELLLSLGYAEGHSWVSDS